MTNKKKKDPVSLFPAELPKGETKRIKLDDIAKLSGIPPTKEFVASVEKWGVMVPITVIKLAREKGQPKYKVVDGRRRVAALIILNFALASPDDFHEDEIEAVVYSKAFGNYEASSILLNVQRGANAISEFQCIHSLVTDGYSLEQITEATGLKKATIKKRLQLANLSKPLINAVIAGKIAKSTAEKIAKLPKNYQETFEAKLKADGLVTGKDVKEASRVRVDKAVAQLDDLMTDDEGEPHDHPMESLDPWFDERAKAVKIVRKICDHFGGNSEADWSDDQPLDLVLEEHVLNILISQ